MFNPRAQTVVYVYILVKQRLSFLSYPAWDDEVVHAICSRRIKEAEIAICIVSAPSVYPQPQAQSHRNTQRSRLPLSAAMAGPMHWRGRYVETPCGRWGICCKETVDELEAERELKMGQMVMCFVVGQMVFLVVAFLFLCVCECLFDCVF